MSRGRVEAKRLLRVLIPGLVLRARGRGAALRQVGFVVALLGIGLGVAPLGIGLGVARADVVVEDGSESELLDTLRAKKLIRAREQAERILRRRPASVVARYAMAAVFHDEEGNLPRALFHSREAEKELARRFGTAPTDPDARTWHRRLLSEQEEILGEMDRRPEQLGVIDRHDALYRPPLDHRRIWPLMKLHRFEEATRLARQVALSEELPLRIAGLNGLLAIESEQLRPRESFKVAQDGVETTGYQSCILLENAAEAAFAVYRFADAERLALKSLPARYQDCPASAYPHLANLYLLRADFQRAMEAVRSGREQGVERRYRQQFEMGNQTWLARLLFTLGHFQKSEELAGEVARLPDRVGMTSFSLDLMRAIALLDAHAALRGRIEELREQAAVRPLKAQLGSWLTRQRLEQKAWLIRRKAGRLLAAKDTLFHLVRPYFKPLPPWNSGELIELVGRGVILAAVEEARRRETMPRETAPYFDQLVGEVAWRRGDLLQAREIGRRVLATLPADEVLLRGRIEAWTADAAWRRGDAAEAERLFHQVLDRFPTALRILGIVLPVEGVQAGPSELAQVVGRALLRSPRLRIAAGLGFQVQVTTSGRGESAVRICLQGRGGRRYACSEKELSSVKRLEERVALALDEFHAKVFAPKVDLTQREINSLDGSAVRGDADEVLKQVLGEGR